MQNLRIVPLGGLGEIGKNMTLLEYNNHAVIVDAGLMFPEGDHLGVDYIIPDMGYIRDNKHRLTIHGVFITHGHEDHTGAIQHVMELVDAPVFGTALTMGLVKNKLKEAKMGHVQINVFSAGDTIKAGPFDMHAFHVCHSIPDCVGFAIRCPIGVVIMTGDYKFDHTPVDGWPTDFATISRYGADGVLALFADSTNADRPGWTPSETVIDAGFDRVFRNAKGRVIVATFASLISRIDQVAQACLRYNRKMAVVGYSMNNNINMALDLGYLDFPRNLIVPLDKAKRMPADKVTFMVTGSQGEPSAVLSRLANDKHQQLEIQDGDTVIVSAHPIPGNEEMVQRTINKLLQQNANVIYDSIENVHVSGHASQEEMKLMINLVKPKFFVPVHGELRHLHSHARIAQELGVPAENCAVVENGTIIEFTQSGGMKILERYPGGYVFVDGHGVGDIGPAVMRDREILANEGFVVIVATVNDKGQVIGEPTVISRGFVYLREAEPLFDGVKGVVKRTLEKSKNGNASNAVENAVGKMLFQETRRRPMIFAHIERTFAQ